MREKRPLTLTQKLLKRSKVEKKKTTKHILISLPLLLLLIVVLSIVSTRPIPEVQSKQTNLARGILVGDIMMAGHVQTQIDATDEQSLFTHVKPYFEHADYATGNFERPVAEQSSADSDYSSTADSVSALHAVGFSVMNLANSHLMDYEEDGLQETLSAFNNEGIDMTGAGESITDETNSMSFNEVNGVTIATLGFSDVYEDGAAVDDSSGGITTFDPETFIPMVAKANQQADVVIVHAHWGQEYDNTPSERQQTLAHSLSDAGADIIVGHHQHVLQSIEVYNDTAIFYSLGNFISDQGWTRTSESALAQFEITENGTTEFEVVPLLIKEASPAPLSWSDKLNERSIIRQLTKDDHFDWTEEEGVIHFSTNSKDTGGH